MFKLTSRDLMWSVVGAIILIFLAIFAGQFIYQKDTFTATVTEIEYIGRGGIFGGSDVTVRFDDGSVYNLYEARIPSELREGCTYTLEYRTPYLLSSPSLAIVESLD